MTLFEDLPETLEALNARSAALGSFVPGGARGVFGEGPLHPPVAFIGEHPGDREDVLGRPFVGPAGQLLDRALSEAGMDRRACYLTTPLAGEVKHYRWWLESELDLVAPRVVATALLALTGKAGGVTVHPSAILRVPYEQREQDYRALVTDMQAIRQLASTA